MPHHHESTHSSFTLLATSATGPHPFPSRTRSLSLSAPMVLRLRGRGRVGRRQLLIPSPLRFPGRASSFRERGAVPPVRAGPRAAPSGTAPRPPPPASISPCTFLRCPSAAPSASPAGPTPARPPCP